MSSSRVVFVASSAATAASFFTLGVLSVRRADGLESREYDARIDAIRAEVRTELGKTGRSEVVAPAGTSGLINQGKATAEQTPAHGAAERQVAENKQPQQGGIGL